MHDLARRLNKQQRCRKFQNVSSRFPSLISATKCAVLPPPFLLPRPPFPRPNLLTLIICTRRHEQRNIVPSPISNYLKQTLPNPHHPLNRGTSLPRRKAGSSSKQDPQHRTPPHEKTRWRKTIDDSGILNAKHNSCEGSFLNP